METNETRRLSQTISAETAERLASNTRGYVLQLIMSMLGVSMTVEVLGLSEAGPTAGWMDAVQSSRRRGGGWLSLQHSALQDATSAADYTDVKN